MTRVNSTGKESSSNFSPDNGTGLAVRTAMKDIFESLRTVNSAAGDPSGAANLAAYQLHINTDSNLLKIRNAANSAFIELGNVSQANFGFLSAAGGTMTGAFLADDAGTASAPAISFDGDTDLGFFRKSENVLGFSASGAEHIIFDQNGITINNQKEIRLSELTSNGTHYVGIKAPSTVSSSNKTITLPDETGTLLTSASSIANSNLANSSVTVGSTAISLGATATTVAGLSTLTSTNLQATNIKDTSGNNSSTTEEIAQGRAKAWINFNGTGTIAERDSFNIAGIEDKDTGKYELTMTSGVVANANYCIVGSSGGANNTSNGAVYNLDQDFARTTTKFRVGSVSPSGSFVDAPIINLAIFGD